MLSVLYLEQYHLWQILEMLRAKEGRLEVCVRPDCYAGRIGRLEYNVAKLQDEADVGPRYDVMIFVYKAEGESTLVATTPPWSRFPEAEEIYRHLVLLRSGRTGDHRPAGLIHLGLLADKAIERRYPGTPLILSDNRITAKLIGRR